jgi:hypothetical protein
MASDITLAVGDGARRMTYAELAQARGISRASAKRLAQRHHWGRQAGNDGVTRATVPLAFLENPAVPKAKAVTRDNEVMSPATGATARVTRVDITSDVVDDITGDDAPVTEPLGRAVEVLRNQLDVANRRIDELHQMLADARTAAMISGCEAAALRAENALLKAHPWWRRWFR